LQDGLLYYSIQIVLYIVFISFFILDTVDKK